MSKLRTITRVGQSGGGGSSPLQITSHDGVLDSYAGPSEGSRLIRLRFWAQTVNDNDSQQTAPDNAEGEPNNTFCVVKTNNAVGDLTNPVEASQSGGWNLDLGVGGPTPTAKRIRVFFEIPARGSALDTLTIERDDGVTPANRTVLYTHPGTAAVNHLAAGLAFDVSSFSVSDLESMGVYVRYLAAVVAAPETLIRLDAFCMEMDFAG